MECLFCKIINKEINADIIFESDNILAFRDISPKAPEHILIIPKKHIATLNEITPEDKELIGEIFLAAKQIAADLDIAEDGYRTVFNCNKGAGQEVFHIHLHLLGGRQLNWPPG